MQKTISYPIKIIRGVINHDILEPYHQRGWSVAKINTAVHPNNPEMLVVTVVLEKLMQIEENVPIKPFERDSHESQIHIN